MSGERKRFDWRKIHEDLDRRLSRLGATYEDDAVRVQTLLRERSARLAAASASRDGERQLSRTLVFLVAGERYAVSLECAQEIVRISSIAKLPGASMPIFGIINWRGEFVAVLDTARILGLKPGEDDGAPYALVLRGGEPRVALTLGALDGIARVDPAALQSPAQLRSTQRDMFRGFTSDAVAVLDEHRLMERLREELHAA